jgi:DNA polymerase-3 subunit epsilon
VSLFRRSPPWESLEYWVLDLETGGLDARYAPIVAVGMVPIRERRVRLGEAFTTLVRPPSRATIAPAAVRTHGLVRADLDVAPPIGAVLPEIERRLAGGVLVAHHAGLDLSFLQLAFHWEGLRWPSPPVVDTAKLLVKLADRQRRHHPEQPADPPPLQLAAARQRLGLPDYPQHDALGDALATAELFLVLARALEARTLRDLTR